MAKQESWLGIPRDEIEWFPTIDYKKCTGCLACVKKCSRGVYSADEKTKKPLVVDKLGCAVGCRGVQGKTHSRVYLQLLVLLLQISERL